MAWQSICLIGLLLQVLSLKLYREGIVKVNAIIPFDDLQRKWTKCDRSCNNESRLVQHLRLEVYILLFYLFCPTPPSDDRAMHAFPGKHIESKSENFGRNVFAPNAKHIPVHTLCPGVFSAFDFWRFILLPVTLHLGESDSNKSKKVVFITVRFVLLQWLPSCCTCSSIPLFHNDLTHHASGHL